MARRRAWPAGEARAGLADNRVEAAGHGQDLVEKRGLAQGIEKFALAGAGPRQQQVGAHACVEEVGPLRDHGTRSADALAAEIAQRHATDSDVAFLEIEET